MKQLCGQARSFLHIRQLVRLRVIGYRTTMKLILSLVVALAVLGLVCSFTWSKFGRTASSTSALSMAKKISFREDTRSWWRSGDRQVATRPKIRRRHTISQLLQTNYRLFSIRNETMLKSNAPLRLGPRIYKSPNPRDSSSCS